MIENVLSIQAEKSSSEQIFWIFQSIYISSVYIFNMIYIYIYIYIVFNQRKFSFFKCKFKNTFKIGINKLLEKCQDMILEAKILLIEINSGFN